VSVTELLGKRRFALQAYSQGTLSKLGQANIFPPTLNTDVSGPNGNVSADPGNERQ
jgi:hypothetical protein